MPPPAATNANDSKPLLRNRDDHGSHLPRNTQITPPMGREIEEKRRVTRREAAALLRKTAKKLEKGHVEIRSQTFPVPKQDLELEIEYEEEPHENEFEIEIEWKPRQVETRNETGEELEPAEPGEAEPGWKRVEITGDEEDEPREPVEVESQPVTELEPSTEEVQKILESRMDYDDVKEEMEHILRGLVKSAENGQDPKPDQLRRFLALNRAFERYAEGEKYEDRMENYSEKIRNLKKVAATGDTERILRKLRTVETEEDACHDIYR